MRWREGKRAIFYGGDGGKGLLRDENRDIIEYIIGIGEDPTKSYTAEEIQKIMKAYIKGSETHP